MIKLIKLTIQYLTLYFNFFLFGEATTKLSFVSFAAAEPAKPFSWAAMASKNTTGVNNTVPPVTSQTAVVKPQPVTVKPEVVKAEVAPNQPQPQRAPR
jgi:hypothetical protein